MFKLYVLGPIRDLLKGEIAFLINIFGLAISFAGFLLILQYVVFEKNYEDFHTERDRIVRVQQDFYQNGELTYQDALSYPTIGSVLEENYPAVEKFVRLRLLPNIVSFEDNVFREEKLYYADASIFSIFSFELTRGNAESALAEPNTATLSETLAKKYFGNENPIGKIIEVKRGAENVRIVVNGVFKDIPANSHINIDLLISYKTLYSMYGKEEVESNWSQQAYYTYLLLVRGTNHKNLEGKFSGVINEYKRESLSSINASEKIVLQALADIHLNSDLNNEADVNGNLKLINYLILISLLIILISAINYINLSTARATKRFKEVGVMKILGAGKKELIKQFMVESALINLIAIVIALMLVATLRGYFNELAEVEISADFWYKPWFWLTLLGLFIGSTLLSGFYPASVMSSFKPMMALKAQYDFSGRGISLRKLLVAFQFTGSITMLIGVYGVYSQIDYMKNKNLGIDLNQTLVLNAPTYIPNDSLYNANIGVFRNRLLELPDVKSFTSTGAVPGSETYSVRGQIKMADSAPDEVSNYSLVWVDYDFVTSFDIDVLAGRNFSKDYGSDSRAVLLNEAAARQLGYNNLDEILGKRISAYGEYEVIGVLNNYHQQYLTNNFEPLIFYLNTSTNYYYSIKMESDNGMESMASIKEVYDQLFPGNPFDHFFLDEYFNRLYKADRRFGQIFGVFTLLAIIIAFIGLLGLSIFTVARRAKEISIRKVIGSSSFSIIKLISKEYFLLAIISSIIAWPIAYWLLSIWLNNYAFKINLNIWLFVIPSILVLLFVMMAIGYQTVKASVANPIKHLHRE